MGSGQRRQQFMPTKLTPAQNIYLSDFRIFSATYLVFIWSANFLKNAA